ncbi:MAG: NifU family protein [Actinomycetota bacterium]
MSEQATQLSGTTDRAEGARDAPSADAVVERLGELLGRLETVRDPMARETAEDLVSTLMEIYGDGLERVFDALESTEESAASARDRLLDDSVVASLLLIHGLYPVDLATRVRDALEKLRPQVAAEGGKIELIDIVEGVVRLRLEEPEAGCNGESSLEPLIAEALEHAAPDVLGIELLSAAEARKARTVHTPLPVRSRG